MFKTPFTRSGRSGLGLLLLAILAIAGLMATACGNGDDAPAAAAAPPVDTTAPAAEPPAPPDPPPEPAAEPAAPEEPAEAPAPPEPPATTTTAAPTPDTTEAAPPPPTTTTEAPPADDAAEQMAEETDAEEPAEEAADEADEQSADEGAGDDFPVTIVSDGGEWTLESAPQRIVSLSPAATEILFAVGAGSQVVAVDTWSTFPPEAPMTDLSGFDPNIEAISAYDPDLVVISYDANDIVAGLTALDIPVLLQSAPSDIEGGYDTMTSLARATGNAAGAEQVIATMRAGIAEAIAGAPETDVRIYHELDETYFSVSSSSFVGAVYAALGAENIADEADPDGYGFPQLSEEYIIEADPELIIITDLTGYTPADVAARPGWESITAVQNGNIVMVSADSASRWGPRLVEFMAAVVEALADIAANR